MFHFGQDDIVIQKRSSGWDKLLLTLTYILLQDADIMLKL